MIRSKSASRSRLLRNQILRTAGPLAARLPRTARSSKSRLVEPRSGVGEGIKDTTGRQGGLTPSRARRKRASARTRFPNIEFARGREPDVALTNPNDIAGKVVGLYKDSAALAGITLEADLAEGLDAIAVDADEIHTCLANLVSNALDACELSDKDRRNVTLLTRDESGTVVFEVKDNGCGMDYEVKQKVFTNFFSTKGSDKGTGLGLLTTRKIVQEHGGRIDLESEPGRGTIFRITLPRNRLPTIALEDGD